MAGRDIITVEGVACGKAASRAAGDGGKLRIAMRLLHPGFIMSLFEGYYRKDLKTAAQLDEQLCGNLCRCTGYRPIRDAAADALAQRGAPDDFDAQLKRSRPRLKSVRYASGDETFLRPTSLPTLFAALARFPDARLIAGATELGLEITKKFNRFPVLVSVEAIPELTELRSSPNEWTIGGAVTLTRIDEALGDEYPELREMLLVFGSRQIRNRATMGGNLVTASPIGDSAPVLLALEAELVLASAKGERRLPLDDFFLSYRKTALELGEVLKSIIVPRVVSGKGSVRKFYKVSKRREMDISTVAGCFAVSLGEDATITRARLAYGGVAAMPARARKTEAALIGQPWRPETAAAILPLLESEFAPHFGCARERNLSADVDQKPFTKVFR